MKTLRTHRSIAIFLVIAAISVTYGAISYVNLPRLLGIGRYSVTVDVPDASGIYPNSVVTLRGVQVGQVDAVRLTPTGAAIDLQIDNNTAIPASAPAQLRSTSAVGEQYLDFEPDRPDSKLLGEGSVVPPNRVALPVPTAELLHRVNTLVASVPKPQLRNTIDDLSSAFSGTGGDLQRLLDSGMSLQQAATANIDPTLKLIRDFQPVLQTQLREGPDTRSFTHNLASFTDQLRMSDSDIRGTLENFPPFLDTFGQTLNQLRPTLPALLNNLTDVGQVVKVYLPNVAQTVTILQPTLNESVGTLTQSPVPNAIKIDFDLVVNDPPSCTSGFDPQRRSPADLTPARPASNDFCNVPHNSPQAVRGAHNALCPPGSPIPGRSPDARGCGWNFQSEEEQKTNQELAVQTQLRVAAQNPQQANQNPLRPPQFPTTGDSNTDPNKATPGAPEQHAPGQAPLAPEPPAPQASQADPSTGLFSTTGAAGTEVFGNAVAPTAGGWAGFLLNPLGVAGP